VEVGGCRLKEEISYQKYVLHAGPVRVNGYLLYDPHSREAAIIDPGGEPEYILKELADQNLTLKYILLTHGHFDHISGTQWLREKTGAQICMNPLDERFITDSEWNASDFVKTSPVPVFKIEHNLKDGDELYLGEQKLHILETPGHTPGELSIYIPEHLFCGDTILKGEIGRWDLPGADVPTSIESVRNKIFSLPEETMIHCGHGEDSTVKYEKEHNRIVLAEERM
jgi:glyoxylase-like metal-dependent hydrolase (beta-lactamase superfamily II)